MTDEYVLGNDSDELRRLKEQHDLWRDDLLKLWSISNLATADRVIDLGCGPGYTSHEILNYSKCSELYSIDISQNFLDYFKNSILNTSHSNRVRTQKSLIEDLKMPHQDFDIAFCRWLLIFVKDPKKAIETVYAHLKPKGQFVIQEYLSYDDMDLAPNCPEMKLVVEAICKSWKDQGGEPNQGRNLPKILCDVGFKIKNLQPIAKVALPTEALWQWPENFFKIYLPRLIATGYLTPHQVADFFQAWNHSKTQKGSFFIAPTVFQIIAEKEL